MITRAFDRLRGLRLLDMLLVFVVWDAGLAFFLLNADHKPALGVVLAGVGLALVVGAMFARSPWAGARLLLAAALVLAAGLNLAFVLGHSADSPFHDSTLLTDAAATRLVQGLDPYGYDYLHSAARFFYTPDVPVNFGLGHYVYPPGMLLLAMPLRALAAAGGPDIGFFGLYAPMLALLAFACYALGRDAAEKRALLIAIALNPLMIADTTVNFFNDVFFMVPLLFALAAIRRDRPLLGGLLLGLSLAMKQQAVLFIPLVVPLLWRRSGRAGLARAVGAGLALDAVCVAGFLAWDPRAFLGDVAGFFYSSGVGNYPVRGLGLPGILLEAGVIPNRWAAFPSAPFQLAVTLPLLMLWVRALWRRWTWGRFWLAAGSLALSVFFLGRVLAPNYIDLVLICLVASLALWVRQEFPNERPSEDTGSHEAPGAVLTSRP